jgi:hypothetical protein
MTGVRARKPFFNDILFSQLPTAARAKKKRRAWQAKPADEILDEPRLFLSFHRRARAESIQLVVVLL